MTKKPKQPHRSSETPEVDDQDLLTIAPESVCYVIVKAREYDAKDEVTEPDPGSNPADDRDVSILEDHGDDPVVQELTAFIDLLDEDAQIDLVALVWLGRDDYSVGDWPQLRDEAATARTEHRHTVEYLLGMPLVSDYLEEGLSMLGYSCEDFEMGHL